MNDGTTPLRQVVMSASASISIIGEGSFRGYLES